MYQPLLSILRHRTVEKAVDRCELSIVEGALSAEDEEAGDSGENDTLESKLIVRFHCKHGTVRSAYYRRLSFIFIWPSQGVVKTHRLPLLTPTSLMTPGVPNVSYESRLTVGPRVIKDMIEHFPSARGAKSDPQLIWTFEESEVEVKSLESLIDSKGKSSENKSNVLSCSGFMKYREGAVIHGTEDQRG